MLSSSHVARSSGARQKASPAASQPQCVLGIDHLVCCRSVLPTICKHRSTARGPRCPAWCSLLHALLTCRTMGQPDNRTAQRSVDAPTHQPPPSAAALAQH
jgi:hypothetical protein